MDQLTRDVRLAHWKEVISRCQSRPKGMTAREWLAENGISNKQYYYWQRLVRQSLYEEMKSQSLPGVCSSSTVAFAEIPVVPSPGTDCSIPGFQTDAVIRIGNATVVVSNSTSAELLGRIMEAVNHAC